MADLQGADALAARRKRARAVMDVAEMLGIEEVGGPRRDVREGDEAARPGDALGDRGHQQRAAGGAAHVVRKSGAPTSRTTILPSSLRPMRLPCRPCRAGRQPVAIEAAETRVTEGNTASCSPHHRLAPRSLSRNGVVSGRTQSRPRPSQHTKHRPPRPCHASPLLHLPADGSRLRSITQEETMQFGYFTMPSHPPERPLKDGHEWDLQVIRWLDELGFAECWIGEHHTAPWEPHPRPDLLVAQGLMQTKNIRLGPGGFLLPYHHPAELANRVAMLDHISGGRLNFGVAASGLPSDWAMFNVDGMTGVNRDMTREALEIILKLWSSPEPFDYKGKFWHVTKPDTMFQFLKPHIKPLQSPHPPIGVAGLSKGSDTLKLAGEKGFLPMSLNLSPAYVGSHWEAVEIGAAKVGRTPDRGEWRMVREVFVADTDEEAFKLSAGSYMGRMMREYFLPLLGQFGFLDYLEARSGRRRFRRHAGLLRQAQLDHRLAQDRHREDREDLRRGRRLRAAAGVRLRLRRQPEGLAPFARALVEGSDAQGAAPQAGEGQARGRMIRDRDGRPPAHAARQRVPGRPSDLLLLGLLRGAARAWRSRHARALSVAVRPPSALDQAASDPPRMDRAAIRAPRHDGCRLRPGSRTSLPTPSATGSPASPCSRRAAARSSPAATTSISISVYRCGSSACKARPALPCRPW